MKTGCQAIGARGRPVRVCIVYENSLFAHGIKELLEQQPALKIVRLVDRPLLSLAKLRRLRPDVVVIEGDSGMAILHSLEGVTGVAISLKGADATVFSGVPLRVSGPKQLGDAIRAVARKTRRAQTRNVSS